MLRRLVGSEMCLRDRSSTRASAPGAERRWLMAPRVFAKLLQLADIGAEARVLDVGCATGYSAAGLGLARIHI